MKLEDNPEIEGMRIIMKDYEDHPGARQMQALMKDFEQIIEGYFEFLKDLSTKACCDLLERTKKTEIEELEKSLKKSSILAQRVLWIQMRDILDSKYPKEE